MGAARGSSQSVSPGYCWAPVSAPSGSSSLRTVGRDTGGMSHCGTGTRLYVLSQRFRLAALRAALGFLQLPPRAPKLRLLHRWLDSWSGIGLVVVGVELQGLRFSLSHIADGEWRATFMAHPMFAPAGFGVAATPWRAVQMAGRGARRSESCLILFHWQRAQVDQIARLEIILRFPLPATRRP
jgi:hypothetical protein